MEMVCGRDQSREQSRTTSVLLGSEQAEEGGQILRLSRRGVDVKVIKKL